MSKIFEIGKDETILDVLKQIEEYFKEEDKIKCDGKLAYFNEDMFNELMNYITNLEQEKNMFKGNFETMSENYFKEKSKIDKAIKYLVLCYDTHFQNNTEKDRSKLLNAIKMLNGDE